MAENEYLTKAEHSEFAKRIDDHNAQQDKEIEALKENVKRIETLTVSVEKMAVSIENMAKEMGKHNDSLDKLDSRLEDIENEPATKWKDMTKYILTAILGIVIGLVAMRLGLQ